MSLAALALSLAAGATQAQTKLEDLRYRATIYGWFPALNATTEFPI